MEIIEIAAPSIQQHNAQIAREAEIVREVDRILRLQLFPSDRVWVDVRFDYGMAEHSSSKVSLMHISGEVHGTVELRLQGLYLWQDFSTFFYEVIPHELAHILIEVRCAERGLVPEKGHSDEWAELVLDINPDAEPSAKVKGDFDERLIKLQKGGIACECDCDGLDAFAVFPNTPATTIKLRGQDLCCSACQSAYRRIMQESWPTEMTKALKFYEGVMAVKVHHPPLSR